MPNLPLLPGTLGNPNCYPASPQTLYNDMFSAGVALAPTTAGLVGPQDAEPAVDERDKVWARSVGGAPVFPYLWQFFNGQWVARHPIAASSSFIFLYEGTSGSIDTLDGGAAGAVSVNSGPFWEIVLSMQARVPVGVGTLPVAGTALLVGDLGGEDKHVLTLPELPVETGVTIPTGGNTAGSSTGVFVKSTGYIKDVDTVTSPAGSAVSHQNMPPFRAVYFIRRTARVYAVQPIS